MLKTLRKLAYGARVALARGGELSMVDAAGIQTQVRSGGDGPPFVYLHSAIGETLWLPFLEKWSKQFTVYAPAHPGYARSGGFDNIRDLDDLVFHYVDLFDALGIDEICLGGCSLGGWVAAEFATRWPERVKKLWVCNSPGFWLDDHPFPDLFRYSNDTQKIRELLFADPNGYEATMIIKNPEQVNDETKIAVYQSMAMLARLMWERPYDPKLPGRLRRVRCPALVIWGEQDKLVPAVYAAEYQRHLPNARTHIIKNCGHLPMFEAEQEFVDVIAKFCNET